MASVTPRAPREVQPLGKLLKCPPRYGINASAVSVAAGSHTYLRITDIDELGRFAPRPKVGVSHPDAADYVLRPGQLVFARTGASVGKSYLYNPTDGELVYAGFLISVEPDPHVLVPKFLALYVQTQAYWDWVAKVSARSGQPGINGREYAQLPVPVVPLLEQQVVAEIASDFDRQIVTLERLIAKQADVKRTVLGKLFAAADSEDLKVRVGDVTTWLSGGTPSRQNAVFWTGEIPWISGATLRGTEVSTSNQCVTAAAVRAGSRMAPLGSTLVLVRGMALHNEMRAAMSTAPVCFNQDIKALVPDSTVRPKYLTYALHANAGRLLSLVTSAGNATGVLETPTVKRLEFLRPDPSEQDRVIAIIDDLEQGLALLRRRLQKAQDLKQGFLQAVLSGRMRVPVSEAEAVAA